MSEAEPAGGVSFRPDPPKPPDADQPRPQRTPGVIPRRVEVPVALWDEVLKIARAGGVDHRDALVALLDLGIQAQSEDRLKPRFLPVSHDLWERVERATPAGQDQEEALVRFVDLGVQARRAADGKHGPPPPRGVEVQVDVVKPGGVEKACVATFADVPAVGDTVLIDGDPHDVVQRAWVVGRAAPYVRVARQQRAKPRG